MAIGYICSILIGIVLGLVGGGGSILSIPVLIFFFGVNEEVSTSYSLFIVGMSSLIGVLQRLKFNLLALRQGILFAIPSTITAFFMRSLIMPNIPEELHFFDTLVSKDTVIVILLGVLMMFTSLKMLVGKEAQENDKKTPLSLVIALGIAVGVLAGFVGAGGGFLIVPALMFMGLPIKKAISTSMLVVTIQSCIAFLGDFNNPKIMGEGGLDWSLLLVLTALTVSGVILGGIFSKKIDGSVLKKGFGILILLVGGFLIANKLHIFN